MSSSAGGVGKCFLQDIDPEERVDVCQADDKEQTCVSSVFYLTLMGLVKLNDRGGTSNAVTFTLALVVMWAESISHKIVPRPLLYCLWFNYSLTKE